MATMNFSIPEDVKRRFNELFGDRNKSEIVTGLMRRAIEDEERRLRRGGKSLVELMEEIRAIGEPVSAEEMRAALDELRK